MDAVAVHAAADACDTGVHEVVVDCARETVRRPRKSVDLRFALALVGFLTTACVA
jgi:hypothetical protein